MNWAKFAHDVLRRQLNIWKNVESRKTKMESVDATPSSSKQSNFLEWMDGSPKVCALFPLLLELQHIPARLGSLFFCAASF
jgi:hypothetical protein